MEEKTHNQMPLYRWVLRWLAFGLLTGVLCGVVGVVFSRAVSFVTDLRSENGWLIYLLPLAGVAIVWIYRRCHEVGVGTNQVLGSVRGDGTLSIWLAPAIFMGTVLTHLCGGSAGREGAALQLGGGVTAWLSRCLKLEEAQAHTLTLCGMSAVFSSVFGTPLGAFVFVLEVIYRRNVWRGGVFPVAVSAFSAYGVSRLLGGHAERFPVGGIAFFDGALLWKTLLIAVLGAIVSMVFCKALHFSEHTFSHLLPNDYLRVVVGGVLLIGLTLLVGSADYNGGGVEIILSVFTEGKVHPEAFALKILFTAVTVAAGYKGGEIIPTFFVGATLGGTLALLLQMDPAFGAAVGMTALFCGVTNCPIASLLIAGELFGWRGVLFYAVAAGVSYLLSGRIGLYEGQESKFSLYSLYQKRG